VSAALQKGEVVIGGFPVFATDHCGDDHSTDGHQGPLLRKP